MRAASLWAGVLGGLVGLFFSLRPFLNSLLNLIGGFGLGPETMLWTALLAVLYLGTAFGCALLLFLSVFRRATSVRATDIGFSLPSVAVLAVRLGAPMIPPPALNETVVIVHFAAPLAGVPLLLAGTLFGLLPGSGSGAATEDRVRGCQEDFARRSSKA